MTIKEIVGAGMFDSKVAFPNVKITAKRKVVDFELEYILESDKNSIVFINNEKIRLFPHTILVRKPGDESPRPCVLPLFSR